MKIIYLHFIFGLLQGCLNISTFISAPTFGIICNIYGKNNNADFTHRLYYRTNYIWIFPNNVSVIIARIISGIFIAGYFVSSMAYVSSITPVKLKLKRFHTLMLLIA